MSSFPPAPRSTPPPPPPPGGLPSFLRAKGFNGLLLFSISPVDRARPRLGLNRRRAVEDPWTSAKGVITSSATPTASYRIAVLLGKDVADDERARSSGHGDAEAGAGPTSRTHPQLRRSSESVVHHRRRMHSGSGDYDAAVLAAHVHQILHQPPALVGRLGNALWLGAPSTRTDSQMFPRLADPFVFQLGLFAFAGLLIETIKYGNGTDMWNVTEQEAIRFNEVSFAVIFLPSAISSFSFGRQERNRSRLLVWLALPRHRDHG